LRSGGSKRVKDLESDTIELLSNPVSSAIAMSPAERSVYDANNIKIKNIFDVKMEERPFILSKSATASKGRTTVSNL